MLMQLGSYQFELNTALYQELTRRTEYRWATKQRHGLRPAKQFLGYGDDTISLTGVVYPDFRGGYGQVDGMREMAATGEPQLMVSGDGIIFGFWVIELVEEVQKHITKLGAPLKQEFMMELSFYGDRV